MYKVLVYRSDSALYAHGSVACRGTFEECIGFMFAKAGILMRANFDMWQLVRA